MRPLLARSISLDSIHNSNKSLPVYILHVIPSVQGQDFFLDPRILKVSHDDLHYQSRHFLIVGSFRSSVPKAAMTGDTLVQSHAMAKSLAKRFAEEAAAPPASDLSEAVPHSTTEADEVLCVANSVKDIREMENISRGPTFGDFVSVDAGGLGCKTNS